MAVNAQSRLVQQGGRSGWLARLTAVLGSRGARALYGVVGFGVVVVVWYGVELSGVMAEGLLPTPHEVLAEIWRLGGTGDLFEHVWLSLRRVLIGVLVGVGAAVPVGFLLGWYKLLSAMFDPVVNFLRALPPIALIPLVVVYFGIGEFARLSVLVYAAFFAGVIVIYEGVVTLDPIYVRAAKVLGASQRELFTRIMLPLSVPTILVALRVALGVSWATLVAAELIAAQQGLGAMIQEAGNFFRIPTIYGGIILIGIAALLMDRVLRLVMNRMVSWQERVQ